MTVEICFYADADASRPFDRWYDRLDPRLAAKVDTALTRLSTGNTSAVRTVGEGVHEIRIDHGPGLRIYFGWDGPRVVVVLGGGIKDRQQDDIVVARRRWRAYRKSRPSKTSED